METVILTPRLRLRPLEASDGPAVIAGVGDLAVSRFLTVVPHPYGPADFAEFLPRAVPGRFWAIEAPGGFCGVISLDARLGFWIAPACQGRGYVTEAAHAVLSAHFTAAGAGSVQSGYYLDNAASARVHAKLGFRTLGQEDRFCLSLGAARSLLLQELAPGALPAAIA